MVAARRPPRSMSVGGARNDRTDAFNLYRSADQGTAKAEYFRSLTTDCGCRRAVDVASHVLSDPIDGAEEEPSAPYALRRRPASAVRVALQRPEAVEGDSSSPTPRTMRASRPERRRRERLSSSGNCRIRDARRMDSRDRISSTPTSRRHAALAHSSGHQPPCAGPHHVQFLVYDLDADGRAEFVTKTAPGTRDGLGNFVADPSKFVGEFPAVVDHAADYRNAAGRPLTGPEFLTIFDGGTGEELASTRFFPERHPDTDFPTGAQLFSIWGDNFGNRVERLYAGIAYLDGHRPSLVWGRGYAKGQQGHPGRIALRAWNWRDGQLTELWTFDSRGHASENAITGQGAHSLSIADLTGDGRHDIVYGQLWVGADGELLRTGWGHGDALHVSNMDPDRPGQHVFQPHESAAQRRSERAVVRRWPVASCSGCHGDRGHRPRVAADVDPRFRGEMWGSGTTGGSRNAQPSSEPVRPARGVQVSPRKPNSINHVVRWTGDCCASCSTASRSRNGIGTQRRRACCFPQPAS